MVGPPEFLGTNWCHFVLIEVHAARGGDLYAGVCPQSKTAGRCAVRDTERTRERLVRLVTSIESDLGDRSLLVAQPPRCSLQPKPAREFERRLADHPAEDAMEVIGQTSDARQCLQFERIVKMLSDVFDGGLNGSNVEGAGVGLHLSSL